MATKNTRKRIITILLVLLLVGGASYAAFRVFGGNEPIDDSGINTAAEQERIDAQKSGDPTDQSTDKSNDETPNENTGSDNNDTKNKDSVTVVITSPEAYIDAKTASINGYVDGVVERGGTCTLTFTDSQGKTVKTSRPAEPDATTTTCGQSSIELSKLHSGKWSVVLSYSSDTSFGKSNPEIVTIP